jgi:hypothetical protein
MPRKTFTAGEVLAAADVNEYLMDQSVMTFADSGARGSAIGTAIAQEGMLTYLEDTDAFEYWDGSAFTGLVPPATPSFVGFQANSTATSTTTSAWTTLAFPTEVYDTNTFHDNVTNNSRVTIPSGFGGYYQVSGQVVFPSNATGVRAIRLGINNTSEMELPQYGAIAQVTRTPFIGTINLTAGDFVTLDVIQTSGVTLTINANWSVTYLGA